MVVLLAALAGLAFTATSAGAVATVLQTFKTSIDVKLDVTERSIWQGIRPGCYAPQEDFDMTYQMRIDSRPDGKKSKVKNGTATLTPASFGVTPNYGDKKSFRQYSSASPWTLETQYPPGCGDAAPAPPAWAVSPGCKKINERVEAGLIQETVDDPDDPASHLLSDDGSLLLVRTPKAAPTIIGASMGESCLRTLHDISSIGLHSNLAIDLKSTLLSVPIPKLQTKLSRLADGSSKSRPSFRVPIRISGDCKSMRMRPSIGPNPDFIDTPFSQPHNALGAFNGDASKTVCMVSGAGSVTVRREGRVVETLVPITTR
ncbi:MAG: hypothetical protein Q7R41_06245 [Phycisphaerales bacterium]|nr:hypothetical protein [Phycisphaerales bacterium]